MKNWEPLESGPELAIERRPSVECKKRKFCGFVGGWVGDWGVKLDGL